MPSEKRARQRAARAEKQAVVDRKQKRRKTGRRVLTYGGLAAVIIIIVVLIQISPAKKKHNPPKSSTTTTTVARSTTTLPGAPTTQPLTAAAVTPTCPPATGSKTRVVWFKSAPPHCIGSTSVFDATFEVAFGSVKGKHASIVVQMDAAKSYAAVNNFVFLARWQYFNGTFFHRVIPGFVVQGGDPTGTGTGGPHQFPGYSFTGNTPPASCKTAPGASCYQPGDIAMANSTGPTTDGSQFFFVLPGGQKTLDQEPNYTDFGHVVGGLPVVEEIGSYGSSAGTPTIKVYVLKVAMREVRA